MSGKESQPVKGNNETACKDSRKGIANSFLQAEEQFENNQNENWKVQRGRNNRKNRQVTNDTKTNSDFRDNSRNSDYETTGKGNKRPSHSHNNMKENYKKPYQNYSTKKTDFCKPHTHGNRQQKQNSYQSCSGLSSHATERSKKEDKKKEFNFGFSYTRLNQLSVKDSTDIIRNLANSRSELGEFLKGNIKPDCMFLIIKILSKLTTSDWDENKEHVLIKATPPEFFKKITEFVMSLVTDTQTYKQCEEIEQFFENLLTLYRAILTVLPTVAAEHLTGPLRATKMAIENVTEYQNVTISANLFDRLKELMIDFDERKKEKEERDCVIHETTQPIYPKTLGNIKDIPIYPRPEDMACKGSIVPNIIKGPYSNVQHYLDVQFRLLREDFVAPVRQGIHEFKVGHYDKKSHGKKKVSNIRIYRKVKFLKPKVISDKVGYDICFDPEKRLNVKWEYSKRFIFGSLLLFTTNNFHTFFLATVVKRDLSVVEKDRIVSVILCDTNELAQDILSKEFLMAESEVYFEPYYTVLKALQKFNSDTFPMKKYFVDVETKTDQPAYTRNGSDVYSISVGDNGIGGRKTIRLFDTHTWPACDELGFDSSQLNAFKAALTNDLVVIQGPPGTGKTYLGLKIAAALLENAIIWNYDHKTPILVICYTNHALDQFLSGIIQKNLTNNVVRIGGRSKSELLEPFNLKERRKAVVYYSPNFDQMSLLHDLKKEMSKIFENIKILQDNLEHLDSNEGILSLKTLQIVMSEPHQKYFRNNDDLLEWLLLGVNHQVRTQKTLISTNDKGVERQNTKNTTEDFGLDLPDFENVTRLKEVLFDSIDLEEPTNQHNNNEIRIYYSYTLEEITKKIEEYANLFESLPDSEGDRKSIQHKMHEVKKAENDLKLIFAHFEEKLKKTGIPTVEETKLVFEVEDVNTLNSSERWLLYKTWTEFLKAGYWVMIGKSEEQFRRGARRYDEVRQFDDLKIVQQADVVGITTTTAARLQSMLRELKPKIVIVEEAAEVLESHIVASLSVSCQHLILIGDHKQLRPSPSEYRLAKDYHLDVSLFERLINNGVNYHTLCTQHRMRPEISRLIVPTIYSSLSDHTSTLNRQHVRGMDKNVFFMTHNHFEEEVCDIMSKKNLFEARMVMLLARHLILQGYSPDEITVLATYSGQMYLMKEEQKRLEISKDLLVTAVDNYQGEENKIILLSLVRSNADKRIGFLKTENRVCVALSRARDGLFVFGNMDCLAADSVLWQKIRQSFIDQCAFGPALILRCEMHQNQLTRIVNHNDFNAVIEGGCSQACGQMLACGHNCKSLCHVSKDRHTKYRCSEPCIRILCKDKHPCAKKCYQDCGECVIPMERTLACGHQIMLPCCVDYGKLQCKEMVNVRYPYCNHEVQLECFRSTHNTCTQPCLFRLECGHACTRACHVIDDPDHLQYVCEKACARRPLGCTNDTHKCPFKCYEECQLCMSKVVRQLPCGHLLTTLCREESSQCTVPCSRKLDCGHPCKNKCFENCGNCNVQVEKVVPLCGHKVQIACSEVPTKKHCKGQCAVKLQCGHKCAKRCCDPCRQEDCVVPMKLTMALPCGHKGALLPCNLSGNINFDGSSDAEHLVQYCSEPCLQTLKCTHLCSGTCGECMQGRIHKVCDEDCGNTLICGHSCPVPCRQVCPPCEKVCQNRCVHTKCPKKCGEPCMPCKELCEYKCLHSRCTKRCGDLCNKKPCKEPCHHPLPCSHPCVGFCGEPCPPCKVCFPAHYEEFFFTGEETEEDAKWVLLNDCKHVVEVRTLELWLGMDQEGSEIKLKTCPKCRPTEPNRFISTTQRYMNLVKKITMDIQAVKEKIFGQVEKIREERQNLLVEIKNIPPTEMEGFPGVDKEKNQLLLLYLRLLKELPVVRNQRRKEIDIEQLRVLIYMANYLTTVVKRKKEIWHQLNEESKLKMVTKINTLTKALRKRDKKISNDEIESFDLELNRIVRFGDFLILESSGEFRDLKTKVEVVQCFRRAEKLITQLSRYTKVHDEKVLNAIQEVKKVIKSNAKLSAREMKEIHLAMSKSFYGGSSAQGHWFKCPKGHPYTITECGGAMEVAKCPINGCGALIGGQNHRYLAGQQLFSEMDGATRPAWSSGNEMNNYDLNNF